MKRISVLCQGDQWRLPDLGHPKCLLQAGTETLLGRTLRLLAKTDWQVDVIGSPALLPTVTGKATLLTLARPGHCVLDGLAQIMFRLDGPTRILLGDVAWSEAALRAVLAEERPLFFAGTPGISPSEGEIFAMGIAQEKIPFIERLLAAAPCREVTHVQGQPGHLRNLLFSADRPVPPLHYDPRLYLPIRDWTRDFDTPADLEYLPYVAQQIEAEGSGP